MPAKPPRPCRKPFCPGTTTADHGYCDDHQHLAVNWHTNRHAGKRTRGAKWQVIRQRILKRDKGLCQECLREDRYTPAAVIDHIKPLAEGGTDADDNLQALCKRHHDEKTQRESRRGRG